MKITYYKSPTYKAVTEEATPLYTTRETSEGFITVDRIKFLTESGEIVKPTEMDQCIESLVDRIERRHNEGFSWDEFTEHRYIG